MESYQHILDKLEAFTSRYYKRRLVKGLFLFLFLGGLSFLFIGGLEYLLWLDSRFRSVLLVAGIVLLGFLFVSYILLPVAHLLRLRRGLTHKEGSRLIGMHFPEVSDKLYNLLELADNTDRSELLLASIEQRSKDLSPVPFQLAVQMKEAYKYSKYALLPLAIIGLIWLSGNGLEFINSYKRVVNYDLAYEPPAPFSFELLTADLRVREDQPFILKLRTPGEVQPDQVRLVLEGSPIIMERQGEYFQHTFQPPLQRMNFYLEAAGVSSRTYTLDVIRVPAIDGFEMVLTYPDYLGVPPKRIQGSGNATVPEGTEIRWELNTIHADSVVYADRDTLLKLPTSSKKAEFARKPFQTTPYSISAANQDIPEFDKLNYQIDVIRDESPEIEMKMEQDSLNANIAYFEGVVSDDHGLSGLKMFAYPSGSQTDREMVEIPIPETTFHTFYYTFPSGLELLSEEEYVVYFEITDNDGNRGGKSRKSREFRLTKLSSDELDSRVLERQNELLKGMDKSAKQREDLQKEFKELLQNQKEKEALSFDDTERLKEFFDKQDQQERLMEKFSRELSESIENEETPENELLKERLEREEEKAKKNAALMEEMKEILEKLDKEELEERMEELSKGQQGSQRSMEQLLELTKRYYVQEKSRQLSRKLSKLSEEQKAEADSEEGLERRKERQRELNSEFETLKKELEELQKDNQQLKKPLPWERDDRKEQSVTKNQEEALESLSEEDTESGDTPQEAKESEGPEKKQKEAGKKLKELSEALNQGAAAGGGETIAEDAEMLRQILDNLVVFSVEQETLFNRIQKGEQDQIGRSGDIKKQQQLRQLFEHVDDSLFALSLRRAEISEIVNTQITEVYYNIDKGLESFAENNWFRGASYQQYVFTAANELSAFLAEMLDNMQESLMPGKGKGQGSDIQLPDIIQSQEQLRQQMQEGGEQEGSKNGQGEQEGQGKAGEQGADGKEGGDKGEQGEKGEAKGSGKGTKDGEGKEGSENGGNSGKGQGDKDGKGQSEGLGEAELAEYYEIYKTQQEIRKQLEQQLENMINDSDRKLGEQIAREMEQFENEILTNGITQKTAERLNRIRQQLMRLENATLKQGEDERRESNRTTKDFSSPVITAPEVFKQSEKETEYLNREALPLRRKYRNRVKQYFIGRDSVPLPNDIQTKE